MPPAVPQRLLARWSSFSLRTKANVIVAIPALPLAVVSVLAVTMPLRESRAGDGLQQTLTVDVRLAELMTALATTESNGRGYALSPTPQHRSDYLHARDEVRGRLTSLHQLADDTVQPHLEHLDAQVNTRLAMLDRVVMSVPPSLPEIDASTVAMNAIRREMAEVSAGQTRLLSAQHDELQRVRRQSRWLIGSTALLGLVGGLCAVFLFARDVRGRISLAKLNAERMSRSEPLLAMQEHQDELGELDRAVRSSARLLDERLHDLESAQYLLDQFFDLSLDMLAIADRDGRFRRLNPAWHATLGWSVAELTATPYFDFVHPDDMVETERQAAHLGHGGTIVSFTNRYRCKDGSYRWLSWKAAADLKIGRIYALARDVTEQRRAHQALEAHVGQLAVARVEAERANRAKTVFLSHVSHDLRTPLNAILGFAQVLENDAMPPDQADSVRQISAAGEYLLKLISDVLDITRVESGQLHLSPETVPVAEIITRATELIEPLARQRDVVVHVAPMRRTAGVFGDRQRIHQILVNLLSNAVKYNRRGGRIDVAVEQAGPERSRIVVADTGFGISPGKLGLLFQPFERLGVEESAIEGTGLGLTLCRMLAEAMGGTIGVKSAEGDGSRFWIELRNADVPELATMDPPAARATSDASDVHGTVLYIEDNSANRRLMQRILSQRPNVDYLSAVDGETGLALARQRQPDLILIDLHLPDMTGEDVLERLWQEPATRDIATVVLTADATPGLPRRLLAAGARHHLTKPLNIGQVLQMVDEFVPGKTAA